MKQLIRHILREHTKEIREMRKITTPEFIEKAKAIHGDEYDYSKVDYKGSAKKVEIICPKHGKFEQQAGAHLFGQGCPKCNIENKKGGIKEFINKSKQIHGDKYDYSKTEYGKDNKTPVKIICPIHGEFLQSPNNHLSGYGCKKCSGQNRSNEEFIELSKKIHGDKYDYSKVNYNRATDEVIIGCDIHGYFKQKPSKHLSGQGCPKCQGKYMDTEEFIRRAKEIHGDKYNYSKSKFISSDEPTIINCPIHGDFYPTANNFLRGTGCPKCQESKGEKLISKI
jgi:Zn finger protein HypA/HybF involved in hydrogenase expression